MSGDYSRDSFDALKSYAGVFMQQGRAALDDNWNVLVAILERRVRAGTVDTIGRCVVPRETMAGFQIRAAAGPALSIGPGRLYHSGRLIENFGAANFPGSGDTDFPAPVLDRGVAGDADPAGVLDELIAPPDGNFLPYERQPHWPTPDPLPEGAGPHLAYLVTWQREVTALEEPSLLEPALGGIDTTTRWQTVWQVRLLEAGGANLTCATPDDAIPDWESLIAPSIARLSTATVDIEDPEDPCLVPPTDGYTGLENQFYRVEVHSVGDGRQGEARFKFSRENASVAAAIERFASPADRVTVRRIGRDEILRFRAGDWVELTDDRRELDHRSGQMLRVALVNEETREIELEGTVDADLLPAGAGGDTPDARRSRLIRWDQRGVIRLSDGSEWEDLDAAGSDGLISVPADGRAIVLESGITVSFSSADGPGTYREMDHWRFAARTAGTQIEELIEAPPDGVRRHYCRLAVVTFPSSVQDCRVFWPPELGGEAERCGCTVCVTPESHNSGALTVQAAIDQIGASGGTVCLDGGGYVLDAPVLIDAKRSLTLRGQGSGTLLLYRGAAGAIRVSGSVDVRIEALGVIVDPDEDAAGVIPEAAGVTSINAAGLALRRLLVLLGVRGEARQDRGIAIDGAALGVTVEECVALAPVALGNRGERDTDEDVPDFLGLAELRVRDNVLFGARAAVRFDGLAINVSGAVFAENLMLGTDAGGIINWFEPPSGWTRIEGSTVIANDDALVLGANDVRVHDCEISGSLQRGDGIRLVPSVVPETEGDAQIIGNRISELAGTGIRIEGRYASLLIERNVIRRCGEAGIASLPDAQITHLAIDNNVIEEIAEDSAQQEAGGIVITGATGGQINGNTVRDVGLGGGDGALYAGIALFGVGRVALEDNAVSGIGPERAIALSVAILGRAPFLGLSVQNNRLIGAPTSGDGDVRGVAWIGIDLGRSIIGGQPGVATSELARVPAGVLNASAFVPGVGAERLAFAEVDGVTFAIAADSFRAIGAVREPQITIGGNQLRNAANAALPMVAVSGSATTSVVFTANQCRLDASGNAAALVQMEAPRIVAGNNVVRRESDLDAMRLTVGENGAATVVGNITFGNIRVLPGGLNPPFDALNLLSS